MNTEHFIAFLSVIGLALCGDSPSLIKPVTLPVQITEKSNDISAKILKTGTEPTSKTTTESTTTTTTPSTTTVSTTTTSTTTPSTTTPSTTTANSDTTTSIPTTPVTPTPALQPTPGTWYVQEGNNTCIVAKLLINLNVTYPVMNGTRTTAWTIGNDTSNPNGTKAIGYCGEVVQNLTISLEYGQNLTLTFTNTSNKDKFVLSAITLTLNATALNGTNSTKQNFVVLSENATLFPTPMQMSYKCDKPEFVNLTSLNSIGNFTASLNLTNVQIQAFRTLNTTKFGDIYDCEAIDTPDVVPIAVGCALIALVLVVLAAYLIGRHHSQSRGYMSID